MQKLFKQILRFGIVGGTAFIIDYALLYICTEYLGIYYFISSIISFSVSTIFNYIASIYWVFDVNKEKSQSRNFVLFVGLSIVGLGINQLIMWFGATAIVMVFNFITRKMFLE